MIQSWSIVVFCYNEAGTMRPVVERVITLFEEHCKGQYEVIIVDDGSTDGSKEEIDALALKYPAVVRVVRHTKNKGIGETLRDGYLAATKENITAVPADGQFDVQELLPYLTIEPKTFVSFYRRENAVYTAFRTTLSAINKYINRIVIGIRLKDVNWVKIYKRQEILSFPWVLHSSLLESELCAKLLINGNRAIEVVSVYHPRVSGTSKGASLRIVMQAMFETIKLILAVRLFALRSKK